MSKKSKEKGLSFVYDRNGEKMHCGVTSISEFRRLGNSNNPLAPQMSEVVMVSLFLVWNFRSMMDIL